MFLTFFFNEFGYHTVFNNILTVLFDTFTNNVSFLVHLDQRSMWTIAITWRPSSVNFGGHLGFAIDIKNSNLVKDIPMIIPLQFGFSQFISFREEDLMVLYKVTVFRSSRIFNNMLWLAEISKIFFSEANELTEPKL
jgi:hypothetical protein